MLTEKEQQELKIYETQLQKPKWKSILFYGFAFILFVFLITAAYEYFAKGRIILIQEKPNKVIARLISYLIGGMAYGLFMRLLFQRRYEKLKKKQLQS